MDVRVVELALAAIPSRYEPLLLEFVRPPVAVGDRYVLLATDGGSEIRLDQRTEQVISVPTSCDGPPRVVNTSVFLFARSIDAYIAYAEAVSHASEHGASEMVRDLRRTIRQIDPAALDDPDDWWSLVLEQAADGLL